MLHDITTYGKIFWKLIHQAWDQWGLYRTCRTYDPIIFICEILSHGEFLSVNRIKTFHFINRTHEWTLNNGALDCSLFSLDKFRQYLQLGKSILNTTDSTNTVPKLKIPLKVQCALN